MLSSSITYFIKMFQDLSFRKLSCAFVVVSHFSLVHFSDFDNFMPTSSIVN